MKASLTLICLAFFEIKKKCCCFFTWSSVYGLVKIEKFETPCSPMYLLGIGLFLSHPPFSINFFKEEKLGLPIQWMFSNWLRLPPLLRLCWNTCLSDVRPFGIIHHSLYIVTWMRRHYTSKLCKFSQWQFVIGWKLRGFHWMEPILLISEQIQKLQMSKRGFYEVETTKKQNLNQVCTRYSCKWHRQCLLDMEKSRQHHLKF